MSAAAPLLALKVPPFQAGSVVGLDIDVYHSMAGISKSGLDLIARSPAHYFAHYLDPQRPPPRERAGQLEGALAHCAVLEPDQFPLRYAVVPPDAPRRPTEAQWAAKSPSPDSVAAMAWWRTFNAENANRRMVTAVQRDTAQRQAQSVQALREVRQALARGRAEVSAFWVDEATGMQCRCRPDWVSDYGEAGDILLDLKTYTDASPAEFARQVARKAYHKQAAFYTDGYSQATGRPVLAFVFVAVETEWPFAACACMLDDDSLQAGRLLYRRDLDVYAQCMRSGQWPAYSDAIELIRLPRWALGEAENLSQYHAEGSPDEPAPATPEKAFA